MSYINYLYEINKTIDKDSKIRNIECIEIINNAIHEAMCTDNNILENCMQVAALIKLFQPFYDGNNRTALIVFGDLITQKGYEFNYTSALENMKNHKLNIPTIYSEIDRVGNFNNWLQYIKKPKKLTIQKD